MKNKKKSVALPIMAVISLFFFVAFVGLFVVAMVLGSSSYITLDWNDILDNVGAAYNVMSGRIQTYVVLGCSAFAAFMFLIATIVCCAKKRPVIFLGAIVGALFAVPFAFLGNRAVVIFTDEILVNPVGSIILIALFAVALIFAVLSVVTWIVSLQTTSKKKLETVTEEVVAEEATTDSVSDEPLPDYQPEPEPEVEPSLMSDKETLTALLREIVRDIVKDELAQHKPESQPLPNQTITGATFSGPLVVQYFNGGIQSAPAPVVEEKEEPAPAEETPVEEVVEEEVVEEAAPVEEPVVEEAVEEPAPVEEVVEEAPVPELVPLPVLEEPVPAVEEQAKAPIVRIPFTTRMVEAEPEMQANYNELKNEILSWGVKSRVSSSGDTFRLHRKTYIKLTIAGKSLKLYFALDPKDYQDSTVPVQNAGDKNIYQDIPLVFKVKSGLSMRRCKQLIQDVMEKDGLEQGTVGEVNWVNEIAAELKENGSNDKNSEDED